MSGSLTFNKALAALCIGGLAFAGLNQISGGLYDTSAGHGKGEEHAQGYKIDTGVEVVEVVEEVVPFAEVYAVASAEAGEGLWRQCRSCHALEAGKNGTGPYLHGVVGRAKGASEGYAYSGALVAVGGDWTPENLSGFLENPKEYAPGTKMAYRGMRDVEDRANLIAYLATFN